MESFVAKDCILQVRKAQSPEFCNPGDCEKCGFKNSVRLKREKRIATKGLQPTGIGTYGLIICKKR